MSSTLLSDASNTVASALTTLTDTLTSAVNSDAQADPLDPVTGTIAPGVKKEKVKSPVGEKLEGFFGKERPARQELQEKGILKDDKVAPALQARQESLRRAQLENTLETQLRARPSPEELVKHHILNEDEDPTSPA